MCVLHDTSITWNERIDDQEEAKLDFNIFPNVICQSYTVRKFEFDETTYLG